VPSRLRYPHVLGVLAVLILAVVITPVASIKNLYPAAAISGKHVSRAVRHDVSPPLASLREAATADDQPDCGSEECAHALALLREDAEELLRADTLAGNPGGDAAAVIAAADPIEQTSQGPRPPTPVLASFDGLGFGFTGPQGTATQGNPSDNSIAVGPNHIVEMVNTRMAVYTKKGEMFGNTGTVLYGAAPNNTIFSGAGGRCQAANSGDAVVRYDQLAERWLYVLPVFQSPFAMCYAVSVGADPLGPYNRYEFPRTLFPDYPRPAVWPDGYYVPTSTGDNVIEKHACVADRTSMLQGLAATEQCVILQGVSFLNNADVDGQALPPPGAPNIVMATGGAQLNGDFDDDGIYAYKFHVDWANSANTTVTGPQKIDVAPYHFLCNGQLTSCVPQPNTTRRLDAQGDKIMQRLVYRNLGDYESIVAVHSVNTTGGGGGVRWYEFRLDANRDPYLYQQGTYAPDGPPIGSFLDNFETQAPGWTVDTAIGSSASANWAVRPDPLAHSLNNSFHTDATGVALKDDRLVSPSVGLSPTSQLIFWHRHSFEGPNFDGGVLELSSDGGSTWVDVLAGGGSFAEGGYNGVISTINGNPIAGRAAWVADSPSQTSMTRVVMDVGAFAGSNVRIRWRLALDQGIQAEPGVAWWVDDVQLTNLIVKPYRWMASPGIDRKGNIGIGYSFGGLPYFAGQRFAGRLADDPLGVLTFQETILVEGESSQTGTLRWEDYTTTAMDPSDDCTFWYVGDYIRTGQTRYTTRIGSFQLPGCIAADLEITKTDSRDPAPTARNLTYTVTVTNNGPDAASGVTVTDVLPPSVTFVSATPSRGTCSELSGTATCSLGTLANAATALIEIVVTPRTAGLITNTVSVAASTTDPSEINNTASENTSICRVTSRKSSIPCG
jgi:uncharacterized repeat protein (TIGR01451 family)